MYWPIAIVQDKGTGKTYTMFTYDSCSSKEDASQWLNNVKKNIRVLFSYIHDDDKKIIDYDTFFDRIDRSKDINIEKGKYYARAIVENDADNSVCRWVSYDAFNSLEEAKARIEEIKGDFKTYFDYVETADDNGKCVPYYENNVDVLGNVKYWDQPNTNNRR
ncbi:MAG: hypothetical protein IJL74_01380 [Bacilli bacterium]|nr:hypothetical protein [Bacilli bacterium]